MTAMRPPGASASRSSARFGAPIELEHDVERPVLGRTRRARRPRPAAHCRRSRRPSARSVVVADGGDDARTRARGELHTGDADAAGRAVDDQRARRCVSPHWVNSASCAVVNTSGKPPASGQRRPSGTAHARCARARPRARPARRRRRRPSRGRRRRSASTPGPMATTSPASSRPGMSAGDAGRRGVAARDAGACRRR